VLLLTTLELLRRRSRRIYGRRSPPVKRCSEEAPESARTALPARLGAVSRGSPRRVGLKMAARNYADLQVEAPTRFWILPRASPPGPLRKDSGCRAYPVALGRPHRREDRAQDKPTGALRNAIKFGRLSGHAWYNKERRWLFGWGRTSGALLRT
jgi:hypothetical protein